MGHKAYLQHDLFVCLEVILSSNSFASTEKLNKNAIYLF